MYERQKRLTLTRMMIILIWKQTHSIAFDDLTNELIAENEKPEPFFYKSKNDYLNRLQVISIKLETLETQWNKLKQSL